MKTNTKLSLIAFMAITVAVTSCKKDKKELPKIDENELFTTIKLKFTDQANTSDVKTFIWRDVDGDGVGNPAVIDNIILKPNTNYNMEVSEILNESATPVQNITDEVKEESDEHLLVYKPSLNLLTVDITDKDKNNLQIGLSSIVKTNTAKNGTLQVILRHQPGVKNGTEAPGSTDFDISFNVKVQ